MVSFVKGLVRNRKGQGLVEYAILVAGIALVAILAVSVLGHKTGDMLGSIAEILPGTQPEDNMPTTVGFLIETVQSSTAAATLDDVAIQSDTATDRLGANVGFASSSTDGFIVDVGT